MKVAEIVVFDIYSEMELMVFAGSLGSRSKGPLFEGLARKARQMNVAILDVKDFKTLAGHGVMGKIGIRKVFLGDGHMMGKYAKPLTSDEEVALKLLEEEGRTVLIIAVDGIVRGLVAATA